MSPKGHNSDLTRLLDGELHDVTEVEQINTAIKADPGLKAEFEEQRSIKSLLGELDEFEAPDFMATRIMGEISAQRSAKQRVLGWKQALSAFGGIAIVAMLAFSMNTNQNIGTPSDLNSDRVAMEAGSPGTDYAAATWTDPDFEESIEDERLRNLMQWASDVHRNSELEQAAGSATPNIDDLVLMVGDEGGSR